MRTWSFLAASHPFGARLFTPASAAAITLPSFDDALPNRAARIVYRLRAVDAAGRMSLDGVTLKGIVRIPAAASIAAPIREPSRAGDAPHRLRLDGARRVRKSRTCWCSVTCTRRTCARR